MAPVSSFAGNTCQVFKHSASFARNGLWIHMNHKTCYLFRQISLFLDFFSRKHYSFEGSPTIPLPYQVYDAYGGGAGSCPRLGGRVRSRVLGWYSRPTHEFHSLGWNREHPFEASMFQKQLAFLYKDSQRLGRTTLSRLQIFLGRATFQLIESFLMCLCVYKTQNNCGLETREGNTGIVGLWVQHPPALTPSLLQLTL